MFSIPLIPADDDTALTSVLSPILGNMTSIWAYQQENWYYWQGGSGTLSNIVPGWGYYINMNESDLLCLNGDKMYGDDDHSGPKPPVVTLSPGWNLIGHYGTNWGLTKREALRTLEGNYATLLDEDGNPMFSMDPFEGYWLFLTGINSLDYAPSSPAYDGEGFDT